MTVFGRDTLITSLQTMLLGPELATASPRRARGAPGAARTIRRSTPSRARSCTSSGAAGPPRPGSARYYGTVDATPLFLSCSRRSGAGRPTRRSSSGSASRRSPRCAGSTSTATATATASSSTSGGRRAGSRTSPGRTRATRSASTTARSRGRRSRRSRCRATSTTRSCGIAELARAVWRDDALAARLETRGGRAAAPLRRAVLGRGPRRLLRARARRREAAASTRSARTSATCSGAASSRRSASTRSRPADGRRALVGLGGPDDVDRRRRLQPAQLPQRHGLAPRHVPRRLGPRAQRPLAGDVDRIARTLLQAARYFGWSLPEVFAGFHREETPFPIAYPTAARPQAWAAGTPVLLLRLLLGLEPDPHAGVLRTAAPVLRVAGRARAQRRPRVRPRLAHRASRTVGSARRLPDMRVAVLSPVWFPVPPSGYGGIEWIVAAARGRARRRRP